MGRLGAATSPPDLHATLQPPVQGAARRDAGGRRIGLADNFSRAEAASAASRRGELLLAMMADSFLVTMAAMSRDI